MKRAVVGLLGCLLLFGATAGADEDSEPKRKVRGPRIVVEPARFDFGEVLPDKTLRKEFTIWNHGSQELLIERVLTDCACTVAQQPVKKLGPGESTPLLVELKTRSRLGRLSKRVLVRSNDPARRTFEVKLRATVVKPKP